MSNRNSFELHVSVTVYSNASGDRLSTHETVDLGTQDYQTAAAILTRFGGFGERVKAEVEHATAQASSADGNYTEPVHVAGPVTRHEVRARALHELVGEILDCLRPAPREPSLEQTDDWIERFAELDPSHG